MPHDYDLWLAEYTKARLEEVNKRSRRVDALWFVMLICVVMACLLMLIGLY